MSTATKAAPVYSPNTYTRDPARSVHGNVKAGSKARELDNELAHENRRSAPAAFIPANGRQLFAWAKREEERGNAGVLDLLSDFGRVHNFPSQIVGWFRDETAQGLAAALEMIRARDLAAWKAGACDAPAPAPIKPEAPAAVAPVAPVVTATTPARTFGEGIEPATTPAPVAPTPAASPAPFTPVVHATAVVNPKAPEPASLYSFLASEVNRLRFEVGHLAALAAADALVVLLTEVTIMGGRLAPIDAAEFYSRRDSYAELARREAA
jgi:hypothetical protein